MSRQILAVTLRLKDGKVLTGRGRNLPATIEKVYNDGLKLTPRRYVTMLEDFKAGYVKKGENRYEGTFHARLAERGADPANTDGDVVVEVKAEK